MKYTTDRPFADPEKAARRILEIANAVEPFKGAFTSRKSTGCSAMVAARLSKAQASSSRSIAAGFTPAGAGYSLEREKGPSQRR